MCSDVAIRVEGLSKRYRVPHRARQGGRLRAHLAEFLPFLGGDSEDTAFWALKDVSFEVKRGEVLGILGRNGSGKSTLLKILSRVTFPTRGRAELHGRVGSLLEVGTGFHPDLSGRENVFMSGALLGVSQREIRARFDEIVDFSGIEEFIDMPVKRYSSGMYVRLAYAVASLLDSDILILDEVLAVGDAAFREKSQKNIERAANDGRTVLFVSHNARAVTAMCQTGIILSGGQCVWRGDARGAVGTYMRSLHGYEETGDTAMELPTRWSLEAGHRLVGHAPVLRELSVHRSDGTPCSRFQTGDAVIFRIRFDGATSTRPYFSVLLQNEFAERVATLHSTHSNAEFSVASGVVECRVDDLRLGDGRYWVMVDYGYYGGSRAMVTSLDCVSNAAQIQVDTGDYLGGIGMDQYQGAVHCSSWRLRADEA
jgi:lipopolysaccharide transport system ATP-binding protein